MQMKEIIFILKCLYMMVARKDLNYWVEIPYPLPSIKHYNHCFVVCMLYEVVACWMGRQACKHAHN
jgi:hypothetical protein